MPKIVHLISYGIAGPNDALHLPRLWQKSSLDAAGKLLMDILDLKRDMIPWCSMPSAWMPIRFFPLLPMPPDRRFFPPMDYPTGIQRIRSISIIWMIGSGFMPQKSPEQICFIASADCFEFDILARSEVLK